MPHSICQDWIERSRDLSRWLARTGLGDRAAFAALYDRTSPHLFAVVLRICRDRAHAQDVLQNVYVRVWRAASSFDSAQSPPLTWLTSIARNQAIDSLRRDRPPMDRLSRPTDVSAPADGMGALSQPQRDSLALAFYDGLSHAELAAAMDQPPSAVKRWVRDALLALRRGAQRTTAHDTAGWIHSS